MLKLNSQYARSQRCELSQHGQANTCNENNSSTSTKYDPPIERKLIDYQEHERHRLGDRESNKLRNVGHYQDNYKEKAFLQQPEFSSRQGSYELRKEAPYEFRKETPYEFRKEAPYEFRKEGTQNNKDHSKKYARLDENLKYENNEGQLNKNRQRENYNPRERQILRQREFINPRQRLSVNPRQRQNLNNRQRQNINNRQIYQQRNFRQNNNHSQMKSYQPNDDLGSMNRLNLQKSHQFKHLKRNQGIKNQIYQREQYDSKGNYQKKVQNSYVEKMRFQRGLDEFYPEKTVRYNETDKNNVQNSYLDKEKITNYSKTFHHTPEKKNIPLKNEPGSTQRKKSLIEKSQILQEKLRKLSSSMIPQENQSKKMNEKPQEFRRENLSRSKRQMEAFSSVQIPGRVSDNKQLTDFEKSKVKDGRNEDKNISKTLFREECQNDNALAKITQLNEKINERIQAIISNFSKK